MYKPGALCGTYGTYQIVKVREERVRVVAIIRKESKSDQLKTPKRGNPAGYVPFICGDHWLYWLKR